MIINRRNIDFTYTNGVLCQIHLTSGKKLNIDQEHWEEVEDYVYGSITDKGTGMFRIPDEYVLKYSNSGEKTVTKSHRNDASHYSLHNAWR
jgi:hypothetical protein